MAARGIEAGVVILPRSLCGKAVFGQTGGGGVRPSSHRHIAPIDGDWPI